jgi:hypothetical protein
VPPQPGEDDLDREIEYAFDTDGLPRRSREAAEAGADARPSVGRRRGVEAGLETRLRTVVSGFCSAKREGGSRSSDYGTPPFAEGYGQAEPQRHRGTGPLGPRLLYVVSGFSRT